MTLLLQMLSAKLSVKMRQMAIFVLLVPVIISTSTGTAASGLSATGILSAGEGLFASYSEILNLGELTLVLQLLNIEILNEFKIQ